MPIKSAAALSIIPPRSVSTPPGLLPCEHVPDAARAIFAEIVSSVAPGHFRPCDRTLLEQLAVAIFIARELADHVTTEGVIVAGRPNQAARHLRQQQATVASLATKLRLTTQSRISKRGAASAADSGMHSISEIYENAQGDR